MADQDFAQRVERLGSLAEPLRRDLYAYVAARRDPVSRDQAASGLGIARHTAKFHLDRLVADGLLETEFRRLSGRDGPGAGRPSKLYRRSATATTVSLPERRYDLAGQVLAEAVEHSAHNGTPVMEALRRVADRTGRKLAAQHLAEHGTGSTGPAPPREQLPLAATALAGNGFEATVDGEVVLLGNCPFHALAQEHTELICGMNLSLVGGLLAGMGCDRLAASLDPAPGRCCVTTSARPTTAEPRLSPSGGGE